MMLALEMFRSLPRTVAGKAMGAGCPASCPGFAAPLRLVTIDPPKVGPSGLGPAALAALRHLRLRPRRAVGQDLALLLRGRLAAVRARPRGGRRAARRLRGPEGRHPRRARPGADLRGPRRRAVRELRGRPHQPLLADHRRPPRARAADRLLQGHRRRLGPAAGRAPQPDARRARGLVRRAGAADGAALVRGAHRAAGRRAGQRPGAGLRRRLGRAVRDAGAAPAHPGRRDHRGRQARPPARPGAGVRRHRGGRSPTRCCAGSAARPAPSSSSRSSPRRTSSAAWTSPSTRSAASSRWRPRCNATRAGGRVVLSGMPAAGRPVRGVVPRARGGRHLRLLPAGARRPGRLRHRRRAGRARRRRPALQVRAPATRCTGGARPSTMPTRPAVSVR